MSRGPSVWSRTGRLEASLQQMARRQAVAVQDAELQEAAERVAVKHGLEPAEVLAEAQALVERAAAAGARTEAEVVAFVAREHGMTEEELRRSWRRWRRAGEWVAATARPGGGGGAGATGGG